MPVGILGVSWDNTLPGLRIARVQGADLTFGENQVPSSTLNQGQQATEDWLNANLTQRVFGVAAPPPYIRVKMRTMTPFFFVFAVSDQPIPSNYFDATPIPGR